MPRNGVWVASALSCWESLGRNSLACTSSSSNNPPKVAASSPQRLQPRRKSRRAAPDDGLQHSPPGRATGDHVVVLVCLFLQVLVHLLLILGKSQFPGCWSWLQLGPCSTDPGSWTPPSVTAPVSASQRALSRPPAGQGEPSCWNFSPSASLPSGRREGGEPRSSLCWCLVTLPKNTNTQTSEICGRQL